ncbi:MAG: HEAT repeat domain-containing protein [Planctomycetes bacterium]|nr:HEAT repeat domain-containing protein [Planctomycetota bacterium]
MKSFCCLVLLVAIGVTGCRDREGTTRSLKLLASPEAAKRAEAARKLGNLRAEAAEPFLVMALKDQNGTVRQSAAKALALIRRNSGRIQPFEWEIAKLSDHLTVQPDGSVRLARSVHFKVVWTRRPVEEIFLFLPPADARVLSVQNDEGSTLPFQEDRDYPQPQVGVSGFAPVAEGQERRVVVEAELHGLLSREDSRNRLRLVYRPGFHNVPVARYAIEVVLPEGSSAEQPGSPGPGWSLERKAGGPRPTLSWASNRLEREAQRTLIFDARVAAESLPHAEGLSPMDRPLRDLSMAGAVFLIVCGLGGLYLYRVRETQNGSFEVRALIVCSLAGLVVFFQPALLEDNLSYYSFARSPLFDGDFNFFDEYLLFNSNRLYFPSVTETPSPSGPAIFWAPCLGLGHGLTYLAGLCGYRWAADGFSPPYLVAVGLGGFCYCLLALYLSFLLARRYVSGPIALAATLLVLFGTNLVLVVYLWTASSFQPSLLMFAVFLYLWHETLGRRSLATWILLGLAGGLMVQVRYQNALLLALPAVEALSSAWEAIQADDGKKLFRMAGQSMAFLLAVFLAFSPQCVIFAALKGQLVVDTYRVGGRGRFEISRLLESVPGMFWHGHPRWPWSGLFSGSPIWAVALAGLVLFVRRRPKLGALVWLTLVLQVLVIGTYQNWQGKVLYVPHLYLTTCSPLLIVGMAAALDILRGSRRATLLAGVLLAAGVFWNFRNVFLQLVFKQVDPFPEQVPLAEALHRLIFLPPIKFRADYVELSGQFAYFLRALSHGLAAGDIREFLTALGPLASVGAGLAWAGPRLARLIRRGQDSSGPDTRGLKAAFAMVLVLLALDAWVCLAAVRTTHANSYDDRSFITGPTYPSCLWGRMKAVSTTEKPIRIQIPPGASKSHLLLIGFLHHAERVSEGTVAARVKVIPSSGNPLEVRIRAGEDVADVRAGRPDADGRMAHDLRGPRPVHHWLIRDGSTSYYQAHAFLCHIRLPRRVRVSSVEIDYEGESGEYVLTDLRLVQPSGAWCEEVLGPALEAKEVNPLSAGGASWP